MVRQDAPGHERRDVEDRDYSMSGVNEIRSTFLDFFARNGHQVVPSSSLVPRNDPTLMFTNAGMVPFKNLFTGAEKRSYTRAASSQKCVRAGGKHNDLDNVGYTARHHTFFEMLGNFSFGDYFKEQAIALAWELIVKHFGLPRDRLLVTVYHDDDEAFGLWKKIAGFSDDRIIRIASSDNFWSMGETGRAAPVRRYSTIRARACVAARPAARTRTATASWSSGTLCSCNMSRSAQASARPCPAPRSTPAWVSNASPR